MTVAELIEKLYEYPPYTEVKVFEAFDCEGPETWVTPKLSISCTERSGKIRVKPYLAIEP